MEVWCGKRRVGRLQIDERGVRGSDYRLPMLSMETLDLSLAAMNDTVVTCDGITLKVGRRSKAIDDMLVESMRIDILTLLGTMNIPESAEMNRDARRQQTIYSWRVFEVDVDTYERLFDLDIFEPA